LKNFHLYKGAIPYSQVPLKGGEGDLEGQGYKNLETIDKSGGTMKDKKQVRLGSDPLSWIRDSREQRNVEPVQQRRIPKQEHQPKTKMGLRPGWIRATFIVREDFLEKIKAVSYWERKDIKQVIDEALAGYLKNKKIKSRPR